MAINVPQKALDRWMSRQPNDNKGRTPLSSGNWVMRPAARNFLERGRFHADQSKRSDYKALCIVEKLRNLDAIDGHTQVSEHGAVFQNFTGKLDIEAAHTLTTTFTLDEVFLQHVKQDGGQSIFNKTYQVLAIYLQGDVTWAPWLFNRLDTKLGDAAFKKLFVQAVKSVAEGESAKDAQHDLSQRRKLVLAPLAELCKEQDIEISVREALGLLNHPMRQSSEEASAYSQDTESLENLVQMYKEAIQLYSNRENVPIEALGGGEIEHEVNSKDWVKADEGGGSEKKSES